VRFQDGLKLDLQRLGRGCAEHGVGLVVDGIQGAGPLPVDLEGVSAFATGVHKGLMAPQGLGLLWTSPALRAELSPLGSWLSVEAGADFNRANTDFDRRWLTDGRKLEHGSPNSLSLSALEVSLRLLREAGPARIAAHVSGLQRALLQRLAGSAAFGADAARLEALRAAGRLGPFLALHHGGRGAAWLHESLRAGAVRGVLASAREGYLRLAFHGWHREEDLERIAGWLLAE
jgi:selenocysteine lyase/cysteine desulfurase